MGADLAYIGSAFIATKEANAAQAYKQMIVESAAEDIVYSNLFTGVHGNYLQAVDRATPASIPTTCPRAIPRKMNFGSGGEKPKAWKDIWGCGPGHRRGQGGARRGESSSTRLKREYAQARAQLCG